MSAEDLTLPLTNVFFSKDGGFLTAVKEKTDFIMLQMELLVKCLNSIEMHYEQSI